jgi:hypothetical protein
MGYFHNLAFPSKIIAEVEMHQPPGAFPQRQGIGHSRDSISRSAAVCRGPQFPLHGTNWLAVSLIWLIECIAIDRTESMDRMQFISPVRISRGPGQPVEDIDGVREAMAFLRKWPRGRRGPVYQCALNCCAAALTGEMSAEEARKAFTGFARITRLLDDDMPLPMDNENRGSGYALRR